MEVATPPPQQQPRGEKYDKHTDQGFRGMLYKFGQMAACEHQRQA
jgi:hypothetical protein